MSNGKTQGFGKIIDDAVGSVDRWEDSVDGRKHAPLINLTKATARVSVATLESSDKVHDRLTDVQTTMGLKMELLEQNILKEIKENHQHCGEDADTPEAEPEPSINLWGWKGKGKLAVILIVLVMAVLVALSLKAGHTIAGFQHKAMALKKGP